MQLDQEKKMLCCHQRQNLVKYYGWKSAQLCSDWRFWEKYQKSTLILYYWELKKKEKEKEKWLTDPTFLKFHLRAALKKKKKKKKKSLVVQVNQMLYPPVSTV